MRNLETNQPTRTPTLLHASNIREQEYKKKKNVQRFNDFRLRRDNIFEPANCSLNVANTRLSLKKKKKKKKWR